MKIIWLIRLFFVLMCGAALAAENPDIFVQLGHQSSISSASFSADGKYLVTGSEDKTLKLWDVASGAEIRSFPAYSDSERQTLNPGHAANVTAVAISDDGELLVSGDSKGVIKLWNTLTGREILSLQGHEKAVHFLSFTPNSWFFVSVGLDQVMKSWDVASGNLLKTNQDVAGLPFMASSNRHVAVRNYSADNFTLLDTSKAVEVAAFKPARNFFTSASFSHDGHYALLLEKNYAQQKSVFEFVDTAANTTIATWTASQDSNYTALSPDGKLALSAGGDGLKLWDSFSGQELKNLTTSLTSVASFSPDGKSIIAAGLYAPTLWDSASGRIVRSYTSRPISSVHSLIPDADGRRAMVNGSNAPPLWWDMRNVIPVRAFPGYSRAMPAMPDSRYMLLTAKDKSLEFWDATENKMIRKLQGSAAAFSHDGRYVMELITDGSVKVWETASGNEVRTYTENTGKIKGFGLSANNRYLLVILDKSVKRVDIARGMEEEFEWAEPYYFGSSISPDGRFITVIVEDKAFKNTLRLYDVEAGREVRSYEDVIPAASATFSPDGRQLLFSINHRLLLCDAESGAELKTFAGHSEAIWDTDFSADGQKIISASSDGSIKLWDSVTTREIVAFAGHRSGVRRAIITPDQRQVVSVGDDKTTRIWDIASGKELAKFISFTDGEWVVITPEGYYNASANGDKYLNVRIGNKVYGVDQYREKFYRPEVVMAAVSGKPISGLVALAAVKPAPDVAFVETLAAVDRDEVTVKLRVHDQGGGIGDVRLYLNGSAVVLDRSRNLAVSAMPGNAQIFSYPLRLVAGKNSLRAVAFNAENSMQSTDAVHEIMARISVKKPALHALLIGIQEYDNPKLTLKYPVADAQLMAATLREQAAGLFESINVVELTSKEQTSKDAITLALQEMSARVGPDDLFVFFVASHGTVDDGEYFLITSNVGATSSHLLKQSALSQDDLKMLIANVPATKKLVFIDTCNAGKLGEAIQMAMLTRGMNEDTALKILSRAVGSTILSASNSLQEALEGYKEHGLFTYVVAEGLRGVADSDKDGYVKTYELVDYVDSRVPELAEQVFNHKQYPTTSLSGQGFPVVRVK